MAKRAKRASKSRKNKRSKPRSKARQAPARKVKAKARKAARRKPIQKPSRKSARPKARGKAKKPAKGSPRKAAAPPPKRRTPRVPPAITAAKSHHRASERPSLDRSRRVLPDDERLDLGSAVRGLADDRMLSAARSGHDDLRSELGKHTETSPELTAGDVDANWQDAYAVGDEAPGGDNPTPDQDRVDDIGRALGIEYEDDQELLGGDEVAERDKNRWEKE